MSYRLNKKIHYLFILNEAGSCIYSKNFSQKFNDLNVDLITPFFSAIFSFTDEVISRKMEVLDFGDLRFIFKIEEKGLIFIILSESTENLLFISNILDKIAEAFIHGIKNLKWDLQEVLQNPDFDKLIDGLILGIDEVLQFKSSEGYLETIEYISDQIQENEIVGVAILTSTGATIYSSLSEDVFNKTMRELEIRHQSKAIDITEHFYTLRNKQKVSEKFLNFDGIENLLLVIQFQASIQLGMVDFYTENIAEKIKSTLLK